MNLLLMIKNFMDIYQVFENNGTKYNQITSFLVGEPAAKGNVQVWLSFLIPLAKFFVSICF